MYGKGYYIILIGCKKHPETIATISYCGKNSAIIENTEQIEKVISKIKDEKFQNVLIIVQTTFSIKKFNEISKEIKNKLDINVEIKNTICTATKNRQEETTKIAKIVDLMIIIGGKNSSNTAKLYEISKEKCKNVIFIETYKELSKYKFNKSDRIGIMAGASTPSESIKEVVEFFKKKC